MLSQDLNTTAQMLHQPLTDMERLAVQGKLRLIADSVARMETRYAQLVAGIERIADPIEDEPETSVRRPYLSVVGDRA